MGRPGNGEGSGIQHVVIIGAGLAGLSAALALAERGFGVTVLERRSIPGGRASSYEAQDTGEPVDNCQHILMRCCTNLLHFYALAGVADRLRWTGRLHFLPPDGRVSILHGSRLPAPFHLMPSFFRLRFLTRADRRAIASAFVRILLQRPPEPDPPFSDWLRAARQTPGALARFWRPIVVSALNEEPEAASTWHAFQLFRTGFLGNPRAYEMGVPSVPLRELYEPAVRRIERLGGQVRYRSPARGLEVRDGKAALVGTDEGPVPADWVVSAVPWDEAARFRPGSNGPSGEGLAPSPISAVHLWWDRPVTEMAHAALLDREVQWMFNKTQDFDRDPGAGTYMGLVVSASRDWLPRSRADILRAAEREVRQAFPGTRGASVRHAAVIKEARATWSPAPGVERLRPGPRTGLPNLFLAGDWVRTGWPATMEGAVRSGFQAAECVLEAAGRPEPVLQPDLPWRAVLRPPS